MEKNFFHNYLFYGLFLLDNNQAVMRLRPKIRKTGLDK